MATARPFTDQSTPTAKEATIAMTIINSKSRKTQASKPPERISAAQYREIASKGGLPDSGGNRGARGVWVGDEYFGSTIEAHHIVNTLRRLEKVGEIRDVRRQVRFPLYVPDKNGQLVFLCDYVCDAEFYDKTGAYCVDDVKGHPIRDTPESLLKIKMAEIQYGIAVRIVRLQARRSKGGVKVVPLAIKPKREAKPRKRSLKNLAQRAAA